MGYKEELIELRITTGMNRREFCEYFEIPYRTVQDWEAGKRTMPEYLLRLMKYKVEMECVIGKNSVPEIVLDANGKKCVQINEIIFSSKRHVDWAGVETYLKQYIGNQYIIDESDEKIFIGSDFPDEYANSRYSHHIYGTIGKAKANASQALPQLIEIATNVKYQENSEKKHEKDAKFGWYRYTIRFSIPVCDENGKYIGRNRFQGRMIVRHDENGKKYLYDIVDIKKET